MFGKRFKLFTLFGFNVHIDASWAILAVLVTWTLAAGYFPHQIENLSPATYWFMGAAGALGLFLSIILHELSHSLVARKHGLSMKGITLFIFGGVAEMGDEPENPRSEFLVAIVGPIASFIIAIVCAGIAAAISAWGVSSIAAMVFTYLSFINLMLALFNLVPAFPLDGGRALRAALWSWKGDLRSATRWASSIGVGFGLALVLLGVIRMITGNFIGGFWLMLIGLFLKNAAARTYEQMLVRRILKKERVGKLMNTDVVTLGPSTDLDTFVEDYVYEHHHRMFPVVDAGKLMGYVTLGGVRSIPCDQWANTTVRAVLETCENGDTISPEENANEALDAMRENKLRRLLVVDEGRLEGVVSSRDILDFLMIRLELDENGPKSETAVVEGAR